MVFYLQVRRVPASILAWACVGVAVALAWAWIHSGAIRYEAIVWPGRGLSLAAESRPYGVVFTLLNHQDAPARRAAFGVYPAGRRWEISEGVERLMTYDPEPFQGRRFGIGFAHTVFEQSTGRIAAGGWYVMQKVDSGQLVVPYAFLFALLLLWPTWRWTKRLARLRCIERGRCVACGYDLRASAERCPECGLAAHVLTRSRLGGRFVAVTAVGAVGTMSALLALHLLLLPRMVPSSGKAPLASSSLPFLPLWTGPRGSDPNRMISAAKPRLPDFSQAVWKSPNGDRLIVISPVGNCMFLEYHTVWEFDRSPRVVRTGSVGMTPGSTPYVLVEIRCDDPGVPSRYRSKWLLAVTCWPAQLKYDPTKPIVLFNPDDRRPNEVSLGLVQWDGEPPDPQNDAEKLLYAPSLQIRPAEDPRVPVPGK